MMAAGRSVFFYHIKFHQLLTQFIVFSLRNRKLSPVYQCDLITLDRTDKFRIYKIAAMDRDQIVSDLFLQVGDTVFYKLFPGCRLYHTFFSKCRNEQNFGYFKKSKSRFQYRQKHVRCLFDDEFRLSGNGEPFCLLCLERLLLLRFSVLRSDWRCAYGRSSDLLLFFPRQRYIFAEPAERNLHFRQSPHGNYRL